MKSKAQVIRENQNYKALINAVVSNIGIESIEDVNRHGMGHGFSGFIYYSDTVAFYKRHRKAINRMVEEVADQLGENVVDMVLNFRCINNNKENRSDAGRCLYGGNLGGLIDDCHVPNGLAWFAAEWVCQMFED